jgi:stearoyl-CoA desaturase (delta-9 desaturase)
MPGTAATSPARLRSESPAVKASSRMPNLLEHRKSSLDEAAIRALIPDNGKQAQTWRANAVFVVFVHVISLYGLAFVTPAWQTVALCLVLSEAAKLGITMGYHRLWSHKSFEASFLLKSVLVFLGTLGFQGSAKWWVHRHRLHHR